MPNHSLIIQVGHIVRDPELSYTPGQVAVCKTAIATSEKYKDKEDTCFIDIVIFGKQAETFSKYMAKGSACLIQGRLKQNKWKAQDGTNRSKHEIMVDKFTFLGKKQESQQQDPPQSRLTPEQKQQLDEARQKVETGMAGAPHDEIPF